MPNNEYAQDLAIAKRFYTPRIIASLLGLIVVATTFYQLKVDLIFYLGPIFQGLFWPHIAYQLTKKFHTASYGERQNLLIDSFFGGLWVPLMAFNLLPFVVLSTTLWLNNISAKGPKFFMKGIVAQLCGVILGVSFVGFQWLPTSNMIVVIACIPILLLYPIFISTISYKLSNALSRQKRVLFHLSQHDALTGLYNRGHWEQQLIQEFKNSRTFNEPTCLILLDIDHFKLVNDRFGHCTGDEVLRRVGKLIRDNLRPLDIPGRYGGEEFGVVLPESSKETAVAVAQRLRAAIEKSLISTTDQHTIKITVSLGVALLNDNTQDCSQWIDNADKALYQAKQSGRNRSILFECENNRQRA